MFKEQSQASHQPSLTLPMDPRSVEARAAAGRRTNDGIDAKGAITRMPEWLRDGLKEYAEEDMPNASWDEVVLTALAAGLGAINGVGSARVLNGFTPTAPASPAPVEPAYPFDRKHVPAFKALCAAVESGPMTLDSVAVEAITGRMGSASLRGIGTFLAGLARKSPVMGLRVEALGRKPGRVTMDYRLSREGSTG